MTAALPTTPTPLPDAVLWAQVMADRDAQRLVRRMARTYVLCGVLDEADLRQAGQIGLLRAAQRFDPKRGYTFITYARWWVRAEMASAMEREGRSIRLPASVVESRRCIQKHCSERGWPAEILDADQQAEMAEVLGLSPRRLQTLLSIDTWAWCESVEEGAEEETSRIVLADETAPGEAELIAELDDPDRTRRFQIALSRLAVQHAREAWVVRAYYGLDGPPALHHEIAGVAGVSRERVRQLVQKGLRRLRTFMEQAETSPL